MFDLRDRAVVDVDDLLVLQRTEYDANRPHVDVLLTFAQHVRIYRQLGSYPHRAISPDGDVQWRGMTLLCEPEDAHDSR